MISRSEMLPLLVESCPSFSEKWERHKRDYSDEEDFLPYVALGELSRHLISLHERGEIGELRAAFATLERLHGEGDAYVKEAATIGLLEGLQNMAGPNAEAFETYLLPESAKWWNQLNLFWAGKIKYVGETIAN